MAENKTDTAAAELKDPPARVVQIAGYLKQCVYDEATYIGGGLALFDEKDQRSAEEWTRIVQQWASAIGEADKKARDAREKETKADLEQTVKQFPDARPGQINFERNGDAGAV